MIHTYDRPLCINPKADFILLNSTLLSLELLDALNVEDFMTLPSKTSSEFRIWMAYLDKTLKGGLKSIRFLSIIDDYHLPDSRSGMALWPKDVEAGQLDGMQWFTGLQELKLAYRDHYDDDDVNDAVLHAHKTRAGEWCKKYQTEKPDCRIPEIKCGLMCYCKKLQF